MSPFDRALDEYAARGWRIFPTRLVRQPNGKVTKQPAIKDWPNVCSCDPKMIRCWWRQFPDAVPSLVTGPRNGIVILDIDIGVDNNGRPYNGFDSLEEIFGWWCSPTTPCAHTRSGGCHFYFSCDRVPDSEILDKGHPTRKTAIRNSASILAPHIDVRGWNGQAVLPAPNSGYWLDPHLTFDVPMLPAPAWFDYRPPKTPRPAHPAVGNRPRFDPADVLTEACRRIRTAPEGTRHDTYRHEVFRVARLVSLGLLDERKAHNDLAAEVMALGQIADGHTARVAKYFERAWAEGLVAGRAR